MDRSDLQRIQHMKKYCEAVARTIKRFGDDFKTFSADSDYLNSVSMSIMQIGELSIGLSDEFKRKTGNQVQWGAIRGMRNLYAHAYAKMDKITIWQTATIDIPGLLNFCNRVITLQQEKSRGPERS